MTPESYNALVEYIIRETGLAETSADAAASRMGDCPETDADGLWIVRSGKREFHIKPLF